MNSGWLLVLFLVAVWFFLLRTRASRMDSRSDFESIISSGQPVVVDFFSNL